MKERMLKPAKKKKQKKNLGIGKKNVSASEKLISKQDKVTGT